MSDLLDLPSWKLGTADLIQQTAAFLWLHKGDDYKHLYEKMTGARVAYELYNRLSVNQDIELFRSECMKGIVDYVKTHPKATEAELTKEVEKHVKLFKERIETM